MIQNFFNSYTIDILFIFYLLCLLLLFYMLNKYVREDIKESYRYIKRYKFIILQYFLLTSILFFILNLIGDFINVGILKYLSFILGGFIIYIYNN